MCLAGTATAQSECAYLDALIDTGLLEQAKSEIRSPSADPKVKLCRADSARVLAAAVKQQLAAAAEQSATNAEKKIEAALASAEILLGANEFDAALAAIKTLPPEALADRRVTAQIKLINAKKHEVAAQSVNRLAELGADSEALKALTLALQKNPEMAVPENLRYLEGGGIVEWRIAKLWIRTYLLPVLEILIFAVIVAFILRIPWRYIVARPSLLFQDFSDKGIAKSPGADVKALMQAAYKELGHGHAGSVTRASGNLEGVALPGSVTQSLPTPLQNPLIQLLPSLLEKILPRKSFTVMGHLLDSDTKGAGLTILVTSHRGRSDGVTLWESEFSAGGKARKEKASGSNVDQSGDFERLANYAAIWLLFRLSAQSLFPGRQKRQLVRALDTSSWRAYSLFQAALTEDRVKNYDAAKELYIEALKEDSSLSIAKINLAEIARREKRWLFAEQLWVQCINTQASALPFIKFRSPFAPYPNEQSHYLAMYKLASLIHQNRQNTKGVTDANANALELSEKLTDAIEVRVRELRILSNITVFLSLLTVDDFRGELRRYLENLRTVNDAMRGGLMIAVGTAKVEKGNEVIDKGELAKSEELDERRRSIVKVGEDLISMGGSFITSLQQARHPLARTQYNLACAFSEWAAVEHNRGKDNARDSNLAASLEHLEKSYWLSPLEKRDVDEDRSLEFLRTQSGAAYDDIFVKKVQPIISPPTVLGRLKTIGAADAAKLKKEKISTVSDMLLRAETIKQRTTISRNIDTGLKVLTDWALAVEIASLQGIEIDDVNLLFDAKITTVGDLKVANPADLTATLNEYAKNRRWQKTYDMPDVEFWIERANNTPAKIQV